MTVSLRPLVLFAGSLALALVGVGGGAIAARSQGLLPHVPLPDPQQLERQGVRIADEASREFQLPAALGQAQVAAWLAPENPQVLRLLGGLYLQAGNLEQATLTLEAARRHGGDQDGTLLLALGAAYLQGGRPEAAESTLRMGLALEPEALTGWFDLGNALIKLERWEASVREFERALALDASFWPALNNIGLVRYEQGKVRVALELWEQSLVIDGTAAEPMLAIAVARYGQGRCGEATGHNGSNREQDTCANAIALGEKALLADPQYGRLDYLRANLWGDRLLTATEAFFTHPRLQPLVQGQTPSQEQAQGQNRQTP
ncbi:MAG: tetratricopeptide repeat protein [Cyanophyceae cyanobacterium]